MEIEMKMNMGMESEMAMEKGRVVRSELTGG